MRRFGTSNRMRSPVCTSAKWPAHSRFRCNMKHNSAESSATHARVGDADHILHACPRKLLWVSEYSRLPACLERLSGPHCEAPEHYRVSRPDLPGPTCFVISSTDSNTTARPVCCEQSLGSCGLFDQRPVRSQVAAQHRKRALSFQRIVRGLITSCPGTSSAAAMESATVPPPTVLASSASRVGQLLHHARNPAGFVQMFHVVLAGRFEVDEHGYFAAGAVEVI